MNIHNFMGSTFDPAKATQAAALLIEHNGGSINRYALIKMLYYVDWLACRKWGHPITGDAPVSMEHGPVLSRICNLTKGEFFYDSGNWKDVIENADEDHVITLKGASPEKDHLSKSEIKIIDEAYAKLGKMTFSQLKKWSHALPEYEQVGKGEAKSIAPEKRLAATGLSTERIQQAHEEDNEDALVKVIFGQK